MITNVSKIIMVLVVVSLVMALIIFCAISVGSDQNIPQHVNRHDPTQGNGYRYKASLQDYEENVIIGRNAISKLYKHEKVTNSQKSAGLKTWDFMGPANIGGKVRTIALVPRVGQPTKENIFLGASSGGIWKSVDDGLTWQSVDDFMASLSIAHITVHPNSYDTLYATTGDGFGGVRRALGAGIFRSADRGNTWIQLPSTNNVNFQRTNRMVINPVNPQTIIVGTTTDNHGFAGDIWRSTDGGSSWVKSGTYPMGIVDLKIDPFNFNVILAGGLNGAYRSTDGGVTFTSISGGANQLPTQSERIELAFAPATIGMVYASIEKSNGELWKSTNAGLTWVAINTGNALLSDQGWHNNTIWVDPFNSNNIVIGGVDVSRSVNGGTSFVPISNWTQYHNNSSANSLHADHHVFSPSLFYSASNPKVYFGNDGGIQMASNIWTSTSTSGYTNLANQSLGITQVIGAAVSKSGGIFSAGTQDNSFHTGSTTSNWFQWSTGDGGHCAIDQNNPNIIYNTIHSRIFKSTDGGVNYNFIRDVDNASYGFPFGMDHDNSQIIFAAENFLWSSNNAGSSWSKIKLDSVTHQNGPHSFNHSISSFDSQQSMAKLWVGYTNGRIERRISPGVWSGSLNNAIDMPNETITSIAINPTNSNEVLVTFAGYHTNNIWYTSDNGATWSNRSLDYPMQVNDIIWHPSNSNWIYIGTDYGIISSEDRGENWALYPLYSSTTINQATDGPVYTTVYQLFWQGDGSALHPHYLCAATYGRGIWRSSKPVLSEIYIDKDCTTCGLGTMAAPYQTVSQALNEAGLGSTLLILSSGLHNEIPDTIINSGRYVIKAMNNPVIIE